METSVSTPNTQSQTKISTSPAVIERPYKMTKTAENFIFGKVIGKGSYSTVYLAKDIHTGLVYAIKVCELINIIKRRKGKYIQREEDALNMLAEVPNGFVKLFWTFQDSNRLYLVLSYAKNGNLRPFINNVELFELNVAKHYAAQLLLALEIMHAKSIVHKDLKPENILLDDKMNLQIADFGSVEIGCSNHISEEKSLLKKLSFVGTANYISPEVLNNEKDTNASDLWAFGCIIYQMTSFGLLPFQAPENDGIYQKIIKLDYEFPEGFPADAKDLVEKLLVIDHTKRLGANDINYRYESIRNHPFFESVDWDSVWEQTPAKIEPYLPGGSLEKSVYTFPDNVRPGLAKSKTLKLLELNPITFEGIPTKEKEKQRKLEIQARNNEWHQFVDGELILKQGLVYKRKCFRSHHFMLLLTTGPRLFYVDPANMVLLGEIPWSPELTVENKNFKTFYVHTPNRTYQLKDPDYHALDWIDAINKARN